MKSLTSKLSRRNFLVAAAAGGVATTVSLAGKNQRVPQNKASAATSGKGYRLTQHVRKYYDSTKV